MKGKKLIDLYLFIYFCLFKLYANTFVQRIFIFVFFLTSYVFLRRNGSGDEDKQKHKRDDTDMHTHRALQSELFEFTYYIHFIYPYFRRAKNLLSAVLLPVYAECVRSWKKPKSIKSECRMSLQPLHTHDEYDRTHTALTLHLSHTNEPTHQSTRHLNF